MVVGMRCEVPVDGRQCRNTASRCRHVGNTGYLFCPLHDWLWHLGRLIIPNLTAEEVAALYHRIHPRSGRDGKGA